LPQIQKKIRARGRSPLQTPRRCRVVAALRAGALSPTK